MRLYGGTIAVVSGLYSIYLSTTGAGMAGTAWLMLVLGIVAAVHGLVLVTDFAARLGDASGPLMIGYAALMLLLQAWLWMQEPAMGDGMDGGGMDGGMAAMADPGMVAVAVIMLVSGLVMTARSEMA